MKGKLLLKQIETFNNLQCPHNFNAFQYFTAITLVHMLHATLLSNEHIEAWRGRGKDECYVWNSLWSKRQKKSVIIYLPFL